MPNRLAGSSSPYLLQHADNPVDWYPWGPEAFERARAEDRPLLLSIGYSACHWCHVMAHESFENPAIAARMNARFVNVKVDREERPDVDALYMEALQAMTGRGGWPLTVFLTPAGEPFYGGTYFPPQARHGLPGFAEVLDAIAEAWQGRRAEVLRSASGLTAALREAAAWAPAGEGPGPEQVAAAAEQLMAGFDRRAGGFGGAPKFPQAPLHRFLIGRAWRARDPELLGALCQSLQAMALGGLRDPLGGGFHRYCVDGDWTVPHFEKMLYDNAQLARLYLEAWQLTAIPLFRAMVVETLDYLLAEMRAPEGPFFAAQDADSPAGEGAYFVWTPEQLRAALPAAEAEAALAWFDVRPGGNFEGGATVLSTRRSAEAVAEELGIGLDALDRRLASARAALLAVRARRPAPATDTKLLTDWNGLAIDALARAGAALGRADYLDAARAAAAYLLDRARAEGGLAHARKDGRASVAAFAEDYAALGGACLSLYEADFDPAWVQAAAELAERLAADFGDPVAGGFFRATAAHGPLLARQKELVDGALPSGNALAADFLLRLAGLTGEGRLVDRAEAVFRLAEPLVERAPAAVGGILAALDDERSGRLEVAVVGGQAEGAGALLEVLRARFLPGVVRAWSPGTGAADAAVALLRHRSPVAGRAAAYVCRAQQCLQPVSSATDLVLALGGDWPGAPEAAAAALSRA